MNKLNQLTDFSMYEGNLPCVLCKGDSSKTLMGNHWKCSVCAHIFNQDGSDPQVQCICDACREKIEDAKLDQEKGMKATLKKIQRKVKRLSKKKTV